MRLRKQKKVVAVTLATAIAVSTISASASAVSYDLAKGDVTIDQDADRGAFSYQGEDKKENRTYVNEDKKDDGKIIIKQDDKDTPTENTVTVQEDVKKTDNADGSESRDVDIVIDGVNADTSKTGESTVTVGEGANVDLTVKNSILTTGGNGIDIGKDLDGTDENKDTKVDLTLEGTTINQTNKQNSAGLDVRQGSDVNLTLKGDNVIDGSAAIDSATKEGKKLTDSNINVEGIRVGGEVASDFSGAEKDAHLTIKGDKEETSDTTEETTGGSLTIKGTTTGMVIAGGSDEEDSSVTITDGADVTIQDTHVSGSTQSGRGVTQHGDLTLDGGSSLTIDGSHVGEDGKTHENGGIGIASWNDIIVKAKSKLNIKNTQTGIYGHQGASTSLTTENSTLNITNSDAGIRYEGSGTAKDGSKLEAAGDITFKDSDVTIEGKSLGIETGNNSDTTVTFDHTTANISAELTKEENVGRYAIYCEDSGKNGSLIVKNGSKLNLQANYGIVAGYRNVLISGNSTVDSTTRDMAIQLRNSKGTKLHITDGSVYNMTDGSHDNYNLLAYYAYHDILVDKGGVLSMDLHNSYSGISLGMRCTLTVDDGTVLVKGDYNHSGIYIDGPYSKISIKNNAHVEAPTIVGNTYYPGQKLVVTGGTLTYDYKADNTLWPVNEQGDKLTNFLLTKDDAHANFDALSYKGQTYTYLSDLNKETGKQYLSVWVPAAALNYMLDVDGSHDPEIIGKALEELKQAGYNFDTAYQTAENGDQVVILRDMVVNGKSLNFTKTTDAEGNTKLIWGNYEKQAEGAPSAYDMVYGTEYEYEGKTYTIVWGYESQNNPNTTAAAGVLDAFGPDSNVKVTGDTIDGTDSAQYTVTIYGALREVTDPVIPTNPAPETPKDPDPTPPAPETPEDSAPTPPAPETPEGSDPTPPAPTTPTTQAVQNARPTTPTVEQAVAKTTPAPESGKLIQTGTTNWMADVLVRAGGVLLAAGYLLERKRKGMFHKAQH
jgi:hypothetical protein